MHADPHGPPPFLPDAPARRWARPFVRFLHVEAASGFVLLFCTVAALALANSAAAGWFHSLWETHARVGIGTATLDMSLLHWINDGLMTVFFFAIGLEIKREVVRGELGEPRKAALPIVGALGGMVAPALVYLSFGPSPEARPGWGIPMATDIAFVVGFLALLGKRVPVGLKVFLLTLAIADDIGAVLVIAVVYSSDLQLGMLGVAALGFALSFFFNRVGVRSVTVYVFLGAGIWLAFLKSGVHPTVAGVMLGLLTPTSAWVGERTLREVLADAADRLTGDDGRDRHGTLGRVRVAAREAASPLDRLEVALHPWVGFFIMPLFALANAGVAVQADGIGHPVALAVAAGLFVGKPLGICLLCWFAVRLGIARLPSGVDWKVMVGGGFLAGIGFTMSLFIAGLALPADLLDAGKIGTLTGSLLSALVGSALLVRFLPRPGAGRAHGEPDAQAVASA